MKKLLIALAILVVVLTGNSLSSQANAAIVFVASSTVDSSAATTLHITTQNSTSTANRMLLCGLSWNPASGSATATSIVASGTSMTFAVGTSSVTSFKRAEIWYMINPGSTAFAVTSTIPSSQSSILSCAVFAGVDQTTGIDSSSSAKGTSASPSVTVNTQANEMVWNVEANAGALNSANAGMTVEVIDNVPANVGGGAAHELATSTTLNTGWTLSGSSNWGEAAVSLLVAPAAASGASDASQNSMGSGIFNVAGATLSVAGATLNVQ